MDPGASAAFKLAPIHQLLYAGWDPAAGVIRQAASLAEARFSESKSSWVIPRGGLSLSTPARTPRRARAPPPAPGPAVGKGFGESRWAGLGVKRGSHTGKTTLRTASRALCWLKASSPPPRPSSLLKRSGKA